MTEEMKLKPCPFCGGEAKLNVAPDYFGEDSRYAVGCKSCLITTWSDGKNEVMENWNRRTPEPDNDALTASYMLGVEKGKKSVLEDPTVSVIRWTRYDGTTGTLPSRCHISEHEYIELLIRRDGRCFILLYFTCTEQSDLTGNPLYDGEAVPLHLGDEWAHLPKRQEGLE